MARTRSVRAHRRVLDAATELIAERGIEGASMDAVANRAGVSKATIYKHWRDKDSLLLELMADLHELNERPDFDTGHPREDIVSVLAYRPEGKPKIREKMTPHLMAYSARNPEFGQAWRHMVMEPPRRELRQLLRKAIEQKELTPDFDIELALAILLGPVLYWHVFMSKTVPVPGPLVRNVVGVFWAAYAINGGEKSRAKSTKLRRRSIR